MNLPDWDGRPAQPKFFGKYKGYVRDNGDPQNRGRLRCYCPQVAGPVDDTNHWLGWAEPNFPWLGGLNTLDFGSPLTQQQNNGVEVGVWIEFEGGDPDFPIWTGTWIPAPTPTDPNAQLDLTVPAADGQVGGDIVNNPPPGSNLSAIDPPAPQVPSNETRLYVKTGRELIIGSAQGGTIAIGPYGVSVTGLQVLINGRYMNAATADKPSG